MDGSFVGGAMGEVMYGSEIICRSLSYEGSIGKTYCVTSRNFYGMLNSPKMRVFKKKLCGCGNRGKDYGDSRTIVRIYC